MTKRTGDRSSAGGGLAPISETKEAFTKLSINDEDDVDNVDETSAAAGEANAKTSDAASAAARAAPERMDSTSSDDPSPIYLVNENTGASWELTWPIWHLLGHSERKDIANRYGYKSIGEFEEYMTLSKATSASAGGTGGIDTAATTVARAASSTSGDAYDGAILYDAEADPRNWGLPTVAERSADDPRRQLEHYESEDDEKPHAQSVTDSQVDDDNDDSSTTSEDSEDSNNAVAGTAHLKSTGLDEDGNAKEDKSEETEEELLKRGGPFLIFPEELSHRVLTYLDIDAYGIMALIHPNRGCVQETLRTVLSQPKSAKGPACLSIRRVVSQDARDSSPCAYQRRLCAQVLQGEEDSEGYVDGDSCRGNPRVGILSIHVFQGGRACPLCLDERTTSRDAAPVCEDDSHRREG